MRPSPHKDEVRPRGPSLFLPKALPEEYFAALEEDSRYADLKHLEKYYRRMPMRKLARQFPGLRTISRIWVDPMGRPTETDLKTAQQIIESAKYCEIRPTERLANPYYEYCFREIEFGSVYPLEMPRGTRTPEAIKNHPEVVREAPVVIKLTSDKGTKRPKGIALPETITRRLQRTYEELELAELRWRVGSTLRNPDQLVLMPDNSDTFSATVRRLDREDYPARVIWSFRELLVLRQSVRTSETEDKWRLFLNLPAGSFAANEPEVKRLPVFTMDIDPAGNLFLTRIFLDSSGNLAPTCRLHPDRDLEVKRLLEELDEEDL